MKASGRTGCEVSTVVHQRRSAGRSAAAHAQGRGYHEMKDSEVGGKWHSNSEVEVEEGLQSHRCPTSALASMLQCAIGDVRTAVTTNIM